MTPFPRRTPRGSARRLVRNACVAAAVLAVAVCSGDDEPPAGPQGPDVGMMEVRVPEAPAATGILLVEVTGPRSGPVAAIAPAQLWSSDASATRAVFLVTGPGLPGPVARFPSPDRREAYTVRVLEAGADASGEYAVLDPADFTVRVAAVN